MIESELDCLRIRARRNSEVVLEAIPAAVIENTDPWINFVIPDSRVSRHVGAPPGRVVANQIVAFSRKQIEDLGLRIGLRAHQFHAQNLFVSMFLDCDNRL